MFKKILLFFSIPFILNAKSTSFQLKDNQKVGQLIDKCVVKEEMGFEWLVDFLYAFPYENYRVYHCGGVGYFIDPINDAIKNFIRKGIIWEDYLQKILGENIQPGETVIDAGAHIGTHTFTMAKCVGPRGKVIAFEPQPKIFRELFYNTALNGFTNIELHWSALGSSIGEIELSPLASTNEGGTPCLGGTGIFVPLKTLDSLELENVALIKVDVESMEEEFLFGAFKTIHRCKPIIVMEIMGGHSLDTASPEIRSIILHRIRFLESFGYQVERISPHDYFATPKNSI